jgi:uncharacterized peroxidase-related enzyme
MPHLPLPSDAFGIVSLFAWRPETAVPLRALAETLLRGPSTLGRGERELIAAYVSTLNECDFCAGSHAAVAARQLEGGREVVTAWLKGRYEGSSRGKLAALLVLAGQVQKSGRAVTEDAVAAARQQGATDVEIHDTVLIAAAFCMFNRYVDGLATVAPPHPSFYDAAAERLTRDGYLGRPGV